MSYKVLTIVLIFNAHIVKETLSAIKVLPIGGIFEEEDEDTELVFKVAIDMINKQNELAQYILEPVSTHIDPEDVIDTVQGRVIDQIWDRPFPALEAACSLLNKGVVSIFTDLWDNSANAIESLCDSKEIPAIRTTPNTASTQECCSIHLFPQVPVLSKAFADLIKYQNWESFTVIYESMYSFVNLAEIFKIYNTSGHNILLQQLYLNDNGNYMDVLKEIRKSKQTRFVIHCEMENLDKILREAQQVGLMMRRYSYIIVQLDLETIDLKQYQHSETNFTSLRLLDQSNPKVKEIARAVNSKREELKLESYDPNDPRWNLITWTALMFDAVFLFAETLKDIENFKVKPHSCDSSDSWAHGSTIFNYMKLKTLDGLTGPLQFDHRGIRSDFILDVIELKESGIAKIGTWDPTNQLQIFPPDLSADVDDPFSLKNKHLKVMIAWSEPYAFYKNSSSHLVGNDQYEGFVIDLIHEISLLEGFNYTFLRNADDKNGDYNATTKSWNGMIGDILNGVGDLAIGDIAVTKERLEVVDFSDAFMSLGIQMIYLRPTKQDPNFLSFAYPFESEVWLLTAVSYLIVSIGLFLMARLCPKEWDIWDRCIQHSEQIINQFTLGNSFWFVIGCLMQQGAEIAPRGASTRILSSFFAFFILVIVSFYKAQLAASLTTESLVLPFNNAEELVNRADKLGISYGAVTNEATHKFFQLSQDKVFKKIGEYMDAHPEHMAVENYEGLLKASEGNYAFFMESITIKYAVNTLCHLQSVGDRINERYFAIAMKKNSPYRNRLSEAILKLQQEGRIDDLERKWWEESLGPDLCTEPLPNPVAPPLNLLHVAGIFWITMIGVLFAFGLAFVELALHVFFICKGDRRAFVEEFKKELLFSFAFNKKVKPLKNGKIVSTPTQSNASLKDDEDD